MTTQQGLRHASARTIAGTTETYEGDLRAMFETEATVPAGSTFDEAFLLWLNVRNGVTDTNINDAMQRFATSQSAYNWSSVGAFSADGDSSIIFTWDAEAAGSVPVGAAIARADGKSVLGTTDGITFWAQEALDGEVPLARQRRVKTGITNGALAGTPGAGNVPTSWSRNVSGGTVELIAGATDGTNSFKVTTAVARDYLSITTPVLEAGEYILSFIAEEIVTNTSGDNITTIVSADDGSGAAFTGLTIAVGRNQRSFHINSNKSVTVRIGSGTATNETREWTFSGLQIQRVQNAGASFVGDPFGGWVDDAITYNALVPRVKYFSDTNGNTVNSDGQITEAAGIALSSIRPNPGLANASVPTDLAIISGASNVDFTSPVIAPTSVFVRTTGDDANGGLSEGDAVRTVDKAQEIVATSGSSGDPFKIDIGTGQWYATEVYPSAPIAGRIPENRATEYAGTGMGTTLLLNAVDPAGVTWNDETDGTYTTTVTDASHAVDLASDDLFGNPTVLTKVADLTALLAASEGFFVVGNVIRVKPIRVGAPDSDLLVFIDSPNDINAFRAPELHIHDLSWIGWGFDISPTSTLYTLNVKWVLEDVLFGYTPLVTNAFDFRPGSSPVDIKYYLRNMYIAYAGRDGADYTNPMFAVEEDCIMYNCGWQDPTLISAQNSTCHNGSQILRLNGNYNPIAGAAQQNIADVDAPSSAWVFNCQSDKVQLAKAWVDTLDGATFSTGVGSDYFFDNVTDIQGSAPAFAAFDGLRGGGMLPEPAATNLVTDADDLSAGSWTATGITPTSQGVTDIGLTTWRLDAGTGTSVHTIADAVTGTGATTGSIFAKAVAGQYLTLRLDNSATADYAVFDLIDNKITESAGSLDAAKMYPHGGGWYEIDLSEVTTVDRDLTIGISDSATPGTGEPSFTGVNETIDVAVPQQEATNFSTSRMISTGSTESRTADVFDTGIVIPTEFSVLLDVTLPRVIGTGNTITLIGPDATVEDVLRVDDSYDVIMDDGGTPVTVGTSSAGARIKAAYGRDAAGRSASLDGATAVTGGAPGAGHEGDNFQLGAANGSNQSRGVHHLTNIYDVRKSDAELESLAT